MAVKRDTNGRLKRVKTPRAWYFRRFEERLAAKTPEERLVIALEMAAVRDKQAYAMRWLREELHLWQLPF